MQPVTKTYARVGRSYPRLPPDVEDAPRRRLRGSYGVVAGLVAVMSALGVIGWLLVR